MNNTPTLDKIIERFYCLQNTLIFLLERIDGNLALIFRRFSIARSELISPLHEQEFTKAAWRSDILEMLQYRHFTAREDSALPLERKIAFFVRYGIELEALREILGWVTDFISQIRNGAEEESLACSFIQMGVDVEGHCDCEQGSDLGDPVLGWIHNNHSQFNRMWWEVLNSMHLIEPIRDALIVDMQMPPAPDDPLGNRALEYGGTVGCGINYAQQLIDHFLRPDPDPAWVGK